MQIHSRLSPSVHPGAFMLLDTWVDGRRLDVGLVRRWSAASGPAGPGQAEMGDVELQQQAMRLLRARVERRSPGHRLQRLVLGDVADPHDIDAGLHEALGHCMADDALLIVCTRREAYGRALRALNLRAGSFMPGLEALDPPAHVPWPCGCPPRVATGREPLPAAGGRRRGDRGLTMTR